MDAILTFTAGIAVCVGAYVLAKKNLNDVDWVQSFYDLEKLQADRVNRVQNPIGWSNGTPLPPTYYINLDRSPDRRAKIEEQFDMYNIPRPTRVPAVDGAAWVVSKGYTKPHWVTPGMTPAEIGCTQSHINAVQLARRHGHQRALILEDDIEFRALPYWPRTPLEVIDMGPSGWGIIRLWCLTAPETETFKDSLIKLKGERTSAAAYIVSSKGMDDILLSANTYKEHKVGLADYYIWSLTPTYTYQTPLIVPSVTRSTIKHINGTWCHTGTLRDYLRLSQLNNPHLQSRTFKRPQELTNVPKHKPIYWAYAGVSTSHLPTTAALVRINDSNVCTYSQLTNPAFVNILPETVRELYLMYTILFEYGGVWVMKGDTNDSTTELATVGWKNGKWTGRAPGSIGVRSCEVVRPNVSAMSSRIMGFGKHLMEDDPRYNMWLWASTLVDSPEKTLEAYTKDILEVYPYAMF